MDKAHPNRPTEVLLDRLTTGAVLRFVDADTDKGIIDHHNVKSPSAEGGAVVVEPNGKAG